jgi:hypothetical protein
MFELFHNMRGTDSRRSKIPMTQTSVFAYGSHPITVRLCYARDTGASHTLAVFIEVDDGPDRIDFGGIHLALTDANGSSRGARASMAVATWVRVGAVELGLDCLHPYLQGQPGTERTNFERL